MKDFYCVLYEGMRAPIKEITIKALNLKAAEKQLKDLDEPAGTWAIYIY